MSDLDARLLAAIRGEVTEPTEDTFTARLDAITEQMVKAAYARGRADERADVLRFLRNEADATFESHCAAALDVAVAWIDRGDHLGATP